MRFNHIVFQTFRYLSVFLLCLLISGAAQAQEKTRARATINATLKVVDEAGSPIPDARIVIGEGMIHAATDQNGTYSFNAYPNDVVTVTAPGFEKSVSRVQDLAQNNSIRLVQSKLYMTSDDNIPLPYMTQKRRNLTGNSKVITGEELEKYPSIDLRNAFSGLATGVIVSENDGSTGISAEENIGSYRITDKMDVTARGSNMTYVIDGMPVDITEMTLDPQEIESVTFINDIVGKAMFGPIGARGIINIKTKRGRPNERVLNVNVESGTNVIDRFPGYVSGADYAILNNLARTNNGLNEQYSQDDIDGYAQNDPYNMYHPSVNFREMMLKNTKAYRRASVSSSGGNDAVQYYSYIGYAGEGDIYKIGSTADYGRVNARTNIDMRINDIIKVKFDLSAGLTNRRSANYGFATAEGNTGMDLQELSSALTDINTTPPVAFPVYANNDPSLTAPWYGVSSIYKFNPIGNLTRNGYYNETGRKGAAKIILDYDMKGIIPGLKSETYLGFDILNLIRVGKAKDYIAYIATPSTTDNTVLLTKVHDGNDDPALKNLHDYFYQRVTLYENLGYEKTFGQHNVQTSLTYFMYRLLRNGTEEPLREQLGVWTGKYTFNDKYSIQGVLNYAGTYSFAKDKRYGMFPSIGASWVISDENFMSGLGFINFLKLRAEAGVLGNETFLTPHYNLDNFTSNVGEDFGPFATGTKWFGTINETDPYRAYPQRIGNPELTWEKRREFSFGIDGLMLDNRLSLELNYFNILRDGMINALTNAIPLMAGYSASLPYFNHNAIRYYGAEAGIRYTFRAGQVNYSVGGNAVLQNSRYEKYDEPQYRFAYQQRLGTPIDTYWGQTFIGKFASDAEASETPQLFDDVLHAGDLKYHDMNGDGFVDDNDQSALGHTTPRLYYALNINMSYMRFDLTLIGDGAAMYDIPKTNEYYWNGWGDNNYSNFVKDNTGGAYPRLTYYKVNNNFVNSDFWLTKGGYFKIQNIELAYTIPASKLQFIGSQGLRLFFRGANLLTITKIKDIDPESIDSGVTTYPLYKTFAGGIKLTF